MKFLNPFSIILFLFVVNNISAQCDEEKCVSISDYTNLALKKDKLEDKVNSLNIKVSELEMRLDKNYYKTEVSKKR